MQDTRTANEVDQMVRDAVRLWKLVRSLEQATKMTEGILSGIVAGLPNRAVEAYIRETSLEED